jgi:hypothetical protein
VPFVVDNKGVPWGWRAAENAWETMGEGTDDVKEAHGFAAGLDGSIWMFRDRPGWVSRWTAETGWQPRVQVGGPGIMTMGVDGESTAWIAGYESFAYLLPVGGGLSRIVVGGGDLVGVLPDEDGGGAGFQGWSGEVFRVEAGAVKRVEAPTPAAKLWRSPEGGLGIWGEEGSFVRRGEQWDAVTPPVQDASGVGEHSWTSGEGVARRLDGGAFALTPGGSLVPQRDGSVYLVARNRLLRSVPGRGVAFMPVTDEWRLPRVQGPALWVADMDGDGLDDLLTEAGDGSLRLLLQRDHAFEDATDDWGLDVSRPLDVVACDFDGSGRPDLLVRVAADA